MRAISMVLAAACGLAVSSAAIAQPTLVPKATFGVNGWRAPGVVVAGDSAGSQPAGVYLALTATGDNERGLAYNPATNDLILTTRNGAINATGSPFRVLDTTTGRDKGELAFGSGVITGGTFPFLQVAASDDGQIFISNLTADTRTSAYKVYKWSSQTASGPTVHFSGTQAFGTGTTAPRLGDSLDAFGSGANVTLATGYRNLNGLFTLTGSSSPTGQVYTNSTTPTPPPGALGMTGTGPATGASGSNFRLGLTFGATASDILGKVTSQPLYNAALSGSGLSATSTALTSAGEGQLDFAVIGGVPYLAALDVNNSRVYVYNISNPAAPVSLFPFGLAAQTGIVNGNGNASGAIKFGAVDNINLTADIYTLNTNNGIQAFTFTVPAPASAALLGLGGLLAARRRRA